MQIRKFFTKKKKPKDEAAIELSLHAIPNDSDFAEQENEEIFSTQEISLGKNPPPADPSQCIDKKLVDEIFFRIADFLDWEIIIRFSMVNRRFQGLMLVNDIWEKIFSKNFSFISPDFPRNGLNYHRLFKQTFIAQCEGMPLIVAKLFTLVAEERQQAALELIKAYNITFSALETKKYTDKNGINLLTYLQNKQFNLILAHFYEQVLTTPLTLIDMVSWLIRLHQSRDQLFALLGLGKEKENTLQKLREKYWALTHAVKQGNLDMISLFCELELLEPIKGDDKWANIFKFIENNKRSKGGLFLSPIWCNWLEFAVKYNNPSLIDAILEDIGLRKEGYVKMTADYASKLHRNGILEHLKEHHKLVPLTEEDFVMIPRIKIRGE